MSYYPPCLGKANCLATLDYVGTFYKVPVSSMNDLSVRSWVSTESTFGSFDPGVVYVKHTLPYLFDEHRSVVRTITVVVRTDAQPISVFGAAPDESKTEMFQVGNDVIWLPGG